MSYFGHVKVNLLSQDSPQVNVIDASFPFLSYKSEDWDLSFNFKCSEICLDGTIVKPFPFTSLSSPSQSFINIECTKFISEIPTEWDDLKVLGAKIGEHTILARRNGDNWYIGAITNCNSKSFTINLDFLDDGEYKLEYIEDGINADTRAIDYQKKSKLVNNSEINEINLAPGGGWIGKLIKVK